MRSKRNRHMMKQPEKMWITLEFDKNTPKMELSSIMAAINRMGLQCKFRAAPNGVSFIEVQCNERQQKDIDKLVRSRFDIARLGIVDFDVNQEILDKATEERKFSLPEDTDKLSVYSAAIGMKSAFEDFPSLEKPDRLLENSSSICSHMLEVDPSQSNDIKLYRGAFIPSYITGYRVGAQQLILMDVATRRKITSEVFTHESNGKGSLSIAIFEEIIKRCMQEVNATKISELFQS